MYLALIEILVQILAIAVVLQLGSAQECGGFLGFMALTPDQLKKEIRSEVATLLNHDSPPEDGSEGEGDLRTIIESVVDAAIEEAVANISDKVDKVDEKLNSALKFSAEISMAVANLSDVVERLVSSTLSQLHQLQLPGGTPSHPATSCREIKDLHPGSPSGHYWIRSSNGFSIQVYCDMTKTCGGITGGWMEVARINMSNSTNACPAGLRMLSSPKRLCGINSDGPGCSSAVFNVQGIEYSRVCGKIIGYQQKTPDAFQPYYYNRGLTIDDGYVDGVSLTHGRNPRKHIWTFAVALHEVSAYPQLNCPCTNIHDTTTAVIPPYIGRDYFCDTASEHHFQYKFYPDDPLWDGQGCGSLNTCCTFNTPPWFMKQLPSPTTDNIEMRLCANEVRSNEDIPVETIELYVY